MNLCSEQSEVFRDSIFSADIQYLLHGLW